MKRPPAGTLKDHLANYVPAIWAHDIRSPRSKRSQVWSAKTGRHHHLLSQLEFAVFSRLEPRDDVVDIREQFLLDETVTREIARSLGFRHPTGSHPMTTDLVVSFGTTLEDATDIAINAKYSHELNNPATIRSINVEHFFWSTLNIPLYVMTQHQVSDVNMVNAQMLYNADSDLFERMMREALFDDIVQSLTSGILRGGVSLLKVCRGVDQLYGLKAGTSLSLAENLMCLRVWDADLSRRIRPGMPLVLRGERVNDWLEEVRRNAAAAR